MPKKKSGKRGQIVSLLSMLGIGLVFFTVVGLAINWNLFIVIGCFLPILAVGLGIIILPAYMRKMHKNLSDKIDKQISETGKKINVATK